MGIDLRKIVKATRFELNPRKALEHKDVILRADNSCATVAYTIPGWRVLTGNQTPEEARTVITEFPAYYGPEGFARLVEAVRIFEGANDLITGVWDWTRIPTRDQRTATFRKS